MHQLFQRQDEANTSIAYSYYQSVFYYNFNLGFGTPVTDVCATCMQYKLQCKNAGIPEDEQSANAANWLVHRRKARMFYDRLSWIVPDAVTICFDVMENLCLPRTPIGQAYYSRQLYMYVFAVVLHEGQHSDQSRDKVLLYTWREDQGGKDSNMISSAVYHALTGPLSERLQRVRELRIFSDSCFGQNRNMAMMSMLLSIAANHPLPLTVEYNFPIRGHSFLPADRVFGRVEQSIRRQYTILLPSDYSEILSQHGRVLSYTNDWTALDYKTEIKKYLKTTRTYKISEARILQLKDGQLGLKASYTAVPIPPTLY